MHKGIVGSSLAWIGTIWAYWETHYGMIAAAFAIVASCVTIVNGIRNKKPKE